VIVSFFKRSIIDLFFGTIEPEVMENALIYLTISAISYPFIGIFSASNALFRSMGKSKTTMILSMVMNAINISGNAILIYGFNMGVKGAALATVISQALSATWALTFLFGKKSFLRIKRKYMKLSARVIFPCIALGFATFIMQSSESIISVCFNASLLKYGGDIAVGAMTILVSVMQFAMLPLQGIAQGAQPILSYNFGAKNIYRLKKTFKILLAVCLAYSFLLWLSVMLFPGIFAQIFTENAPLLNFTEGVIRIYFAGMLLFGIQVACQMTLVSLGYALSSVIVAVVRKFVLILPLIYIMPSICTDKTIGVYMAEPIADIIAVTFTSILFLFTFKKALRRLKNRIIK
jgi:putative MATE family efflux protein